MKIRRYPDGCCAVVKAGWRGPCRHSKKLALKRWRKVGFIARSNSGC